jgi:hypothetical protein
MPGIDMYWLKDKTAPFATFLSLIQAYYHPEVRNDEFDLLVGRARANRPDDLQLATFKQEFVSLLEGDREGLHPEAIDAATEYDEWDTDDEFLVWLWQQLYPNEPVPGHSDSVGGS